MPQTPGRKGYRGQQRFEMAGRQVDDQPPDRALPHRRQFRGDDLEVPAPRQLGLRVEIVEAARGEGAEVLPQDGVVLGPGKALDHSDSHFLPCKRAFSCSMTFSSAGLKEVSGDAGSVRRSMSWMMSIRILVARRSALAERLTSCLMMAWRLVIFRRRPFSATMTGSFSASLSTVARFFDPLGRPRRLPARPVWKRGVAGWLAVAHLIIALLVRRHWLPPRRRRHQICGRSPHGGH